MRSVDAREAQLRRGSTKRRWYREIGRASRERARERRLLRAARAAEVGRPVEERRRGDARLDCAPRVARRATCVARRAEARKAGRGGSRGARAPTALRRGAASAAASHRAATPRVRASSAISSSSSREEQRAAFVDATDSAAPMRASSDPRAAPDVELVGAAPPPVGRAVERAREPEEVLAAVAPAVPRARGGGAPWWRGGRDGHLAWRAQLGLRFA